MASQKHKVVDRERRDALIKVEREVTFIRCEQRAVLLVRVETHRRRCVKRLLRGSSPIGGGAALWNELACWLEYFAHSHVSARIFIRFGQCRWSRILIIATDEGVGNKSNADYADDCANDDDADPGALLACFRTRSFLFFDGLVSSLTFAFVGSHSGETIPPVKRGRPPLKAACH